MHGGVQRCECIYKRRLLAARKQEPEPEESLDKIVRMQEGDDAGADRLKLMIGRSGAVVVYSQQVLEQRQDLGRVDASHDVILLADVQ